MNKINNRRKKESQEKIEKVFIELIQNKNADEISITDICKFANLNRSTFYSNYIDIYDLVEKIKDKMMIDFFSVYKDEIEKKYHSYDFLKLFQHIKENQLFYRTYFKLNFDMNTPSFFIDKNEVTRFLDDEEHLEYHVEFFKAGLNAIIKKWLDTGCLLSPEEMENIIKKEYVRKRNYV